MDFTYYIKNPIHPFIKIIKFKKIKKQKQNVNKKTFTTKLYLIRSIYNSRILDMLLGFIL